MNSKLSRFINHNLHRIMLMSNHLTKRNKKHGLKSFYLSSKSFFKSKRMELRLQNYSGATVHNFPFWPISFTNKEHSSLPYLTIFEEKTKSELLLKTSVLLNLWSGSEMILTCFSLVVRLHCSGLRLMCEPICLKPKTQ